MSYNGFGYMVDSCPLSKEETSEAATRLNCSVDENGRSQYVCVPNQNFTTLIEFCYTKTVVGLYQKGNCLRTVSDGFLDQISCKTFTEGCPTEDYRSTDVYRYPLCHLLNTKDRCFVADPMCNVSAMLRTSTYVQETLHTSTDYTSFSNATETALENESLHVGVIIGVILSILIGILVIGIVLRHILQRIKRKRSKRSRRQGQEDVEISGGGKQMEELIPKSPLHDTKSEDETEFEFTKIPKLEKPTYKLIGNPRIWKTSISDRFSKLTDDELSVLFCFLCSDSGPPDFIKKEWMTILQEIRQKVFRIKNTVTKEEVGETFNKLKSLYFLWEDTEWKCLSMMAQNETMYCVSKRSLNVTFYLCSFSTTMEYLRSRRYRRKREEKCVISSKDYRDFLLIRRLQMNILTHITLEDTEIFDKVSYTLNIPRAIMQENKENRRKIHRDLKTGDIVKCREGKEHVTWLWRYEKKARPDIVRSCIGLYPHYDIYIIDNKAYRKQGDFHKCDYTRDVRCFLYSILLIDKYTLDVNEQDSIELFKKLRDRYFTNSSFIDIKQLPEKITEQEGSKIKFKSNKVRHDVMYAFVTECLVRDSDLEFFLTTASNTVVSEYCRSWDFKKEEGERCLYVPNYPEKLYDLFVKNLQVLILTHSFFSEKESKKRIVKYLKISEEVLKWDFEERERFVKVCNQGSINMCRATCMIVGCADAGKTTLLKNLQRTETCDSKNVTEKTKGLEIHEDLFEIKNDTLIDFNRKMKDVENGIDLAENRGKHILSVMDFAGQVAYYACHQIYLSRRAFYIVVTDMSQKLDKRVHGTDHQQTTASLFDDWTYKDYFLFWLQSIKTYCEYGKAHSEKPTPVILIASHHDVIQGKTEKTSSQTENTTFYDKLQNCLPNEQALKGHISSKRYFEIECPEGGLSVHQEQIIENVRKCIAQTAKGLAYWGEKVPFIWKMFEHFLRENKEKKILSREVLRKIKEFKSLNKSEISDMLGYFREIGLIIYFEEEGLNENMIVDINWFIDAFKNIITDPEHAELCKSVHEKEIFLETGRISHSTLVRIWGENSSYVSMKKIIIPYMEKLGILATVGTKEVDDINEQLDRESEIETEPIYYIPSMNRTDFSTERRTVMKDGNKTPVLIFSFKSFIPHFFFFRLVALCFSEWDLLSDDLLCKNIAFYTEEGGDMKIAIAVNKTSIHLQVFTLEREIAIDFEKTREIRRTIIKMIKKITTNLHHKVYYTTGYACKDIEITDEDEDCFLSERRVTRMKTNETYCPNYLPHKTHEKHKIIPDDLLHYWCKNEK